MTDLLKDHKFNEFCKVLKVVDQSPSDPDRRVIEKAFRRLALKTHPDKGGDPVEFRLVNDAYNRLICHIDTLEIIEAEAELSNTSVVIEVSKHSLPKWWDKLKTTYGKPRTANVANTIFQGPYKQYKGRGKVTGPITLVLYEDPEDKVPKIHCRCDNYMAWIQEQKMPLHLHVGRDKKIMFDQWRIMSLAEFGFVSLIPGGASARHNWKETNSTRSKTRKEEEEDREAARRASEAAAKAKAEAEARAKAEEEAKAKEEAEAERLRKEEESKNAPWWKKYTTGEFAGFTMGETTPPPEDDNFPKVFSMTSNSYTPGGRCNKDKTDDESSQEKPPDTSPPEKHEPSKTIPDPSSNDVKMGPKSAANEFTKTHTDEFECKDDRGEERKENIDKGKPNLGNLSDKLASKSKVRKAKKFGKKKTPEDLNKSENTAESQPNDKNPDQSKGNTYEESQLKAQAESIASEKKAEQEKRLQAENQMRSEAEAKAREEALAQKAAEAERKRFLEEEKKHADAAKKKAEEEKALIEEKKRAEEEKQNADREEQQKAALAEKEAKKKAQEEKERAAREKKRKAALAKKEAEAAKKKAEEEKEKADIEKERKAALAIKEAEAAKKKAEEEKEKAAREKERKAALAIKEAEAAKKKAEEAKALLEKQKKVEEEKEKVAREKLIQAEIAEKEAKAAQIKEKALVEKRKVAAKKKAEEAKLEEIEIARKKIAEEGVVTKEEYKGKDDEQKSGVLKADIQYMTERPEVYETVEKVSTEENATKKQSEEEIREKKRIELERLAEIQAQLSAERRARAEAQRQLEVQLKEKAQQEAMERQSEESKNSLGLQLDNSEPLSPSKATVKQEAMVCNSPEMKPKNTFGKLKSKTSAKLKSGVKQKMKQMAELTESPNGKANVEIGDKQPCDTNDGLVETKKSRSPEVTMKSSRKRHLEASSAESLASSPCPRNASTKNSPDKKQQSSKGDGGFPTAHSTTTNPTEYSQLQQDEGRTKATTEQSLKSHEDNVVKSSRDVTSSVVASSLSNEKHSLEGEKNYVTERTKAATRNSENSDSPNYCSKTIGIPRHTSEGSTKHITASSYNEKEGNNETLIATRRKSGDKVRKQQESNAVPMMENGMPTKYAEPNAIFSNFDGGDGGGGHQGCNNINRQPINSNTNVTLNIDDVNIDTSKGDVIEAKLIEKVSSNHAANIVVPKVVSHNKSDVSAENSNKPTAINGNHEKDEFIATSVAHFIEEESKAKPSVVNEEVSSSPKSESLIEMSRRVRELSVEVFRRQKTPDTESRPSTATSPTKQLTISPHRHSPVISSPRRSTSPSRHFPASPSNRQTTMSSKSQSPAMSTSRQSSTISPARQATTSPTRQATISPPRQTTNTRHTVQMADKGERTITGASSSVGSPLSRSKSMAAVDKVPSRWTNPNNPTAAASTPQETVRRVSIVSSTYQDIRASTTRSKSIVDLDFSANSTIDKNPTTRMLSSLAKTSTSRKPPLSGTTDRHIAERQMSDRQKLERKKSDDRQQTVSPPPPRESATKIPSRFLRRMSGQNQQEGGGAAAGGSVYRSEARQRLFDQISRAKTEHQHHADEAKNYTPPVSQASNRSSTTSSFNSSTSNVNRIQSLSPTPSSAAATSSYTGGSSMHSHYRVPRSPSMSRRVAAASTSSSSAGLTRARTVTDLSYDARQARREERRTLISGRTSPGPSRFTGSSGLATTSQTMPSRLRSFNS